jgi:hypothetical protein
MTDADSERTWPEILTALTAVISLPIAGIALFLSWSANQQGKDLSFAVSGTQTEIRR